MSSNLIYVNVIAIVFALFFMDYGLGQQNGASATVGTHRVLPKTHFQCGKRPSGYYADVETGCQVYHMCDGLGRQFSYACPNTTLFQQRMLICDHWYMVNCSKAESDYGANLLIGQRDKPFVREDEQHELRTPRPDLLDRPYAADYSGESFRNIYKLFPPIHNSLIDISQKDTSSYKKISTNEDTRNVNKPLAVPAHWSTLHPSKFQVQSTTPSSSTNFDTLRRNDHRAVESSSVSSDLKVSSSQDSRRSENEIHFENTKKPEPKPLIIEYQPPFLYPIYNQNYTPETSTTRDNGFQLDASTYKAIKEINDNLQRSQENEPSFNSIDYTNNFAQTTPSNFIYNRLNSKVNQIESRIVTRPNAPQSTASSILQTSQPTPFQASTQNTFSPIVNDIQNVPVPPSALLPPFENFHVYDDATTQGPPIYYEWKIPASGLEPPLLEHNTNNAIDDNQNQIPVIPPETKKPTPITIPFLEKELVPPIFEASSSQKNHIKVPADDLQPPQVAFNSKADTTIPVHSFPSVNAVLHNSTSADGTDSKSQTQRSVSSTSTNKNNDLSTEKAKHNKDQNYLDLKKLFLIPEFTFPLETHEGPGYASNDAVNSFQIKIPDQEVSGTVKKPWYGENAQCPECHPSFLKPGSCEPCIKIR